MNDRPESATDPGNTTYLEFIAVVILAVTAVLTAWSGFEASKWGGEMSIAFSRASTARTEASRLNAQADAARGFDLNVFGIYIQAAAEGDDVLRDFVEQRFTDHFEPAFHAWIKQRPLQNPDAPASPFALPEYQPPGQAEADEADSRADELFAQALENNQRGDDYTLLTVLFALVLFFSAVSQRLKSNALSWVVLSSATALLAVGVSFLIAFPKII